MARIFNVTGSCNPKLHYMVDITDRLRQIKTLVDQGAYFTINRARQYGKTTTLDALFEYLKKDYIVVSLDFQMLGNEDFSSEIVFSRAFVRLFLRIVRNKRAPVDSFHKDVLFCLETAAREDVQFSLGRLFELLSDLCDTAAKPVVMMIDEVDSATNNQVFLDFLAQMRAYYLKRQKMATFWSVILAGVYDVKNIRLRLRPDAEHKVNSPWNIAADFLVDMSFSVKDIRGMLDQYESDHHTGMDTGQMAEEIYNYTSGYPFLVSKMCKLLDERIAGEKRFPEKSDAWTKEGICAAVNLLVSEKSNSSAGPELLLKMRGIISGSACF